MKKGIPAWAIIIGIIVILGGFFLRTHNRLVKSNEEVDNQWAQVESQYQRRFDLIPNLVESVKGAMSQETEVFTNIALSRLLVVIENYPELKSLDTVKTLMSQLEGTENRIAVERQRYNDQVKEFNADMKTIPTKWIASMFGFEEKAYFESEEGSEVAPKVDLTK
jgi:LemA protein